ncbi:MAG TPA: MotA/TolQ/ExbB proton channel family protein, partial [Acetobacteraceae bacterium]
AARRRLTDALNAARDSADLGSLRDRAAVPVAVSFAGAALTEMEASQGLPPEGIKDRIVICLRALEGSMARRLQFGTGILASIGSCAPFIGLLGTVWGIMNSFVGISQAHTTNLAVVAPGIAEALLATACGLLAAIPAVLTYNFLARMMAGYRAGLGDLTAVVLTRASRQIDGQIAIRGAAQARPAVLRAAAE